MGGRMCVRYPSFSEKGECVSALGNLFSGRGGRKMAVFSPPLFPSPKTLGLLRARIGGRPLKVTMGQASGELRSPQSGSPGLARSAVIHPNPGLGRARPGGRPLKVTVGHAIGELRSPQSGYLSLVTRHLSLVTWLSSLVTRHWPLPFSAYATSKRPVCR